MLNVHSQREDIRATLPNLLAILSVGEQTMEKYYYGIQESASASFLAIDGAVVAPHDDDVPMSAISETSIDMMVPIPATKVYSASEENISVPEHSSR